MIIPVGRQAQITKVISPADTVVIPATTEALATQTDEKPYGSMSCTICVVKAHAKVCLALMFFWLGLFAHGESPSQLHPTGYVNDFANVLDSDTKVQLTDICQQIDQKAHAQIAVVTIHSLDGRDVQEFAVDLFTRWRIGPKKTDRGVLILYAIQDHRYWTEVAYGL